jgi:hypothetical protein
LPSPFLLPATLVAAAIAISVASTLFVARHTPRCCNCPPCCRHHHSPNTLVTVAIDLATLALALFVAIAIALAAAINSLFDALAMALAALTIALFDAIAIALANLTTVVAVAIAIVAIICPPPSSP